MRVSSRHVWPSSFCLAFILIVPREIAAASAELYDPVWASDLGWTGNNLFNRPAGSAAYLENAYVPWWQGQTAHPITDYSASKLPTGVVRLDGALDMDYTVHRTLPGWTSVASPTNINNVYTFVPGSTNQQDRTGRSGQYGFLDFGMHPFKAWSADIGAEFVGNYDDRYWFPVNDEHRMFNNDQYAKIVRGEIKYDNSDNFMMRGFEGVPLFNWLGQNDLFGLLPGQIDNEYDRLIEGSITPRGGEVRWKSVFGTLDVIGGSEIRLGYGSSVYAKYDLPVMRKLEQSLVYRNENIPFGLESTDERRWSLSYNASYPWTDRVTSHAGLMYQPFRLNRPYQDASSLDGNGAPNERTTDRADALGFTTRTEVKPVAWVDEVGLGYTYLGPVAGDKHQVETDVTRAFGAFTLSGAYIYRQPVIGPVPLIYEGTVQNLGALVASPRGPDDPFWVQWDNRKAHLLALTLLYDPTPGTPFFKYQRNVLEDWNINPDEDAVWIAAIQYRLTDYLTNTDRLYYWDEDRVLHWDPVYHSGAFASDSPLSSFSALVRWKPNAWRFSVDCSAGEALAGLAQAYTSATDFYKPSTIYVSAGSSATNGLVNLFFRFGSNVWGPVDYQVQNGWAYHQIFEAGVGYNFLRDLQAGFRYVGTRMTSEFIGADTGAFNEYTLYLTYHFSVQHNFGSQIAAIGRPIPQTLPESGISVSDSRFTPDGSGPTREILISPHATSESGLLSWKLVIRNSTGETVHQWEGSGPTPDHLRWDGLDANGKPLPLGTYRLTLDAVDLYGNEVTSPAQVVEIESLATKAAEPAAGAKSYKVTSTAEGLKVTLSSMILFDVDQSTLKDNARQGLDQVFELLKAYPTNVLRISGYSDATGSDSHNQTLSLQRAQAVADYLISKGITKTRVSVSGYGKRRPVASNKTEEGRQQNRRVEIDILK